MPSRRRFLATAAATAPVALAGCSVLGGGRERWRASPGSQVVQSPPVARDGTVYALTGGGVLAALDAGNGDARWANRFQDDALTGPALDGSSRLYLGDNDLVAVDLGEGDWDLDWWLELLPDGEEVTAAAIGPRRVYVGTDHGRFVAVETADPMPVWERSVGSGEATVQSIRPRDGRVVAAAATDYDGVLAAYGPDGDPAWTETVDGFLDATVADDAVFVAQARSVRALDPADGTERWATSPGPQQALTAGRGTVYAASDDPDPSLLAFDADTGDERWTASLSGVVPRGVPPTVADGTVYVPEYGAARVSAYATDGERVWRHDLGDGVRPTTRPVHVDGTVVVGAGDELVALDA